MYDYFIKSIKYRKNEYCNISIIIVIAIVIDWYDDIVIRPISYRKKGIITDNKHAETTMDKHAKHIGMPTIKGAGYPHEKALFGIQLMMGLLTGEINLKDIK